MSLSLPVRGTFGRTSNLKSLRPLIFHVTPNGFLWTSQNMAFLLKRRLEESRPACLVLLATCLCTMKHLSSLQTVASAIFNASCAGVSSVLRRILTSQVIDVLQSSSHHGLANMQRAFEVSLASHRLELKRTMNAVALTVKLAKAKGTLRQGRAVPLDSLPVQWSFGKQLDAWSYQMLSHFSGPEVLPLINEHAQVMHWHRLQATISLGHTDPKSLFLQPSCQWSEIFNRQTTWKTSPDLNIHSH